MICPQCGKDQSEEAQQEQDEELAAAAETSLGAEPEDEAAAQTDAQDESGEENAEADAEPSDMLTAAEPEEAPVKKKKNLWLLGALVVVAVAAVAVLVVALIQHFKADEPSDDAEFSMVDENGEFVAHDFSKPAEEVTEDMANTVVAKCGDTELTNVTLSYYYWQLYYSIMSSYGSYMIDTTKPLSEQMYDDTHTWQDIFLQSAMSSFQKNAALSALAEEEGFQLDEQYESYLTSMKDNIAATAEQAGYADADAYLQASYGPYATVDSYLDYARATFLASNYLDSKTKDLDYSEDDVSAYYDDNAEDYASQGVEKNDTKMVNVRHILIAPVADEGAEKDKDGNPVLTDANWATALKQAEDLLAQWKAGDATEDSFAALAKDNSTDTGSASNGGLYENVYPGEMQQEFSDWCFDAARKVGDTGIVKTKYGYHIMYFSAFGDQTYWYSKAESDYVKDRQQKTMEDLVEKKPFEVSYDKVVLTEPAAQ